MTNKPSAQARFDLILLFIALPARHTAGATANRMLTRLNEQRHLILLIFILLLFVISPMVAALQTGVLVLNVVGAGLLIAASYTLSGRRRYLFVTAIVLTCWVLYAPSHVAIILSHTSIVVLVGFFVVAILGYVLRESRVTADKIYAAICVYLLIGYGWSFAYSVLDEAQPNAFSTPTPIERGNLAARVVQLRYFSFVTLTTMGYGDITPRSGGARTLAVFEAIIGQVYLVTLVGRLVGLHIVHCDTLHRDDSEP